MAIYTIEVENAGPYDFLRADMTMNFPITTTEASWVVQKVWTVIETINVTGTISAEDFQSLIAMVEKINFTSPVSSIFTAKNTVEDSLAASDSVIVPFFDTIVSTLNSTDDVSFDPRIWIEIVDELVASSVATNAFTAIGFIQDVINVVDTVAKYLGASISESINVTPNIIDQIVAKSKIVDSLNAVASSDFVGYAVFTIEDEFNTTTDISVLGILKNHIKDIIGFEGVINFDGDSYTFVLNTENEAISTYTNYNFNSFSGGLAANSTGIYELVGADDEGNVITSTFRTGLMDFGESLHKQVPYAYLGVSSDGTLVLKTIVDTYGVKKERYYTLTTQRDAVDTARIQLGKGVKSRYWAFELANSSGADFLLESMEILPIVLKRRI